MDRRHFFRSLLVGSAAAELVVRLAPEPSPPEAVTLFDWLMVAHHADLPVSMAVVGVGCGVPRPYVTLACGVPRENPVGFRLQPRTGHTLRVHRYQNPAGVWLPPEGGVTVSGLMTEQRTFGLEDYDGDRHRTVEVMVAKPDVIRDLLRPILAAEPTDTCTEIGPLMFALVHHTPIKA